MRHIVEIAEIKVAKAPDIMVSIGLGSCIAVALYDRERKIGGMSHALLPVSNGFSSDLKKFVDKSIVNLLELMESSGANKKNMIAKIVGGASIFSGLKEVQCIGERNVISCRQVLSKLGISIAGEDVGGNHGRSVEFYTTNGEVIVKVGQRVKCII
jgi:chemotaxis protein CheD